MLAAAHERLTARKKTLNIGYISNSLHAALIGIAWMRGATSFWRTLCEMLRPIQPKIIEGAIDHGSVNKSN